MERIKTLIVDDEKPARRVLRGLLEKDPEIEVVGEAMHGERALELIAGRRPRLMFLDVQMPILSGIELLARLPAGERPEIIFVTAYDDYALTAFDVQAVDYLVKPFSDARFHSALARAKRRVHGGTLSATERTLRALLEHFQRSGAPAAGAPAPARDYARLVVKADGQLHFLNQTEIRWIEAQGDFVKIHLVGGRGLLVRKTLNSLAGTLDPRQFVRIHKSTIVNLGAVRRVVPMRERSHGMELDDGKALIIGPSYRSVFDRLK
ncbi:MAG: response regulator transcription factor [Opitutae bacterium]|nr:response regulator transcription factor [Opitutae bacterium]